MILTLNDTLTALALATVLLNAGCTWRSLKRINKRLRYRKRIKHTPNLQQVEAGRNASQVQQTAYGVHYHNHIGSTPAPEPVASPAAEQPPKLLKPLLRQLEQKGKLLDHYQAYIERLEEKSRQQEEELEKKALELIQWKQQYAMLQSELENTSLELQERRFVLLNVRAS